MMSETVQAQLQLPQHLEGARTNGSLFAQQDDLISFISYGAD